MPHSRVADRVRAFNVHRNMLASSQPQQPSLLSPTAMALTIHLLILLVPYPLMHREMAQKLEQIWKALHPGAGAAPNVDGEGALVGGELSRSSGSRVDRSCDSSLPQGQVEALTTSTTMTAPAAGVGRPPVGAVPSTALAFWK